MLSPNVSVVSTTGTTEGDTVTLQCEDGLSLVIFCNHSGVWSPNPAELVCQGELCIILPVSVRNYVYAHYHIHCYCGAPSKLSKRRGKDFSYVYPMALAVYNNDSFNGYHISVQKQ